MVWLSTTAEDEERTGAKHGCSDSVPPVAPHDNSHECTLQSPGRRFGATTHLQAGSGDASPVRGDRDTIAWRGARFQRAVCFPTVRLEEGGGMRSNGYVENVRHGSTGLRMM